MLSAVDKVISIPELLRQVFLHLNPSSLTQCCKGSRYMYHTASPILYRHVPLDSPKTLQRLMSRTSPRGRALLEHTRVISLTTWFFASPRLHYTPEEVSDLFPHVQLVRLEHHDTTCHPSNPPHSSKCVIRLAILLKPQHLVLNLTGVQRFFKCIQPDEVARLHFDEITIRLSPFLGEVYTAVDEIVHLSRLAKTVNVIFGDGFPSLQSVEALRKALLSLQDPCSMVRIIYDFGCRLVRASQDGEKWSFYVLDNLSPPNETDMSMEGMAQFLDPSALQEFRTGGRTLEEDSSIGPRVELLGRRDWLRRCPPFTMPEGYEEKWRLARSQYR